MANNRMFLICKVCNPDPKADWPRWDSLLEQGFFHLAKWYPGEIGDWYTNRPETIGTLLDEFFTMHAHPDKYPGGTESPFRLDYEWEGTPDAKS